MLLTCWVCSFIFFFFQAEDGIRDHCVTGVQTCALPILLTTRSVARYLRLSAEEGGCNRTAQKVSIRSPWHRTPLPEPPHAFISGMAGGTPTTFFNPVKNFIATNTLFVMRFFPKLSFLDLVPVGEYLQKHQTISPGA